MSIDTNDVALKLSQYTSYICLGNHRRKLPRTERDLRCGDSGFIFQNFNLVTS